MTYAELKAMIAEKIAKGEPIKGYLRELMFDMAVNELEEKKGE